MSGAATSAGDTAAARDDRELTAARLASRAAGAPVAVALSGGEVRIDDAGGALDAAGRAAAARLSTQVAASGRAAYLGGGSVGADAGSLRAFGGVPFESGAARGCLAVADVRPRRWTASDRAALDDAAALLSAHAPAETPSSDERLRESRREFSTLLSNLPGAAYRCRNDPRWTVEFVSDAVAGLTGYAPDELTGDGLGFAHLIVPDDRERVRREVQAAIAQGRPFEVEYRITRRDGQERWIHEHGVAVGRPGGEARIEGFIADITDARRTEVALRRGGDYFRALIETSAEVVGVGNPDGSLRYVSAAVERVTGYTPDEWLGMKVWETAHPDELPRVKEAFAGLVSAHGATVEVQYRIYRKDGRSCVLEVSARNLMDDPAVRGIVYNARDVTERVESEEEIRRRERHFRSLIENAHDVISVLERDGRVRFASPSIQRILGYERERLSDVSLLDLVHPDDAAAVGGVLERAVRSPGEPQLLEFRIRHADGSWRTLESIGTGLLHDPAVAGIVVNSRDVTERNRAEEALRLSQQQLLQSQKMDAVGRLAGGVAHDFNNLLTAIRGNAELLLLDTPPADPRRGDVEEIRRAADRAAALTRQLLAFSRRQVLQPRVIGLNGVIQEVERMLRRLIGADVELETRLGAELRQVRADPGQIEQVLLNLAVNARDAMPGGGRLTVETGNTALGEELKQTHPYAVPGDYVMLAVADTGHGMDAETRERAFEPFFTTKPAGRGTGLGLSTVYGIVKQSGGFVWIDSEPGVGTSVRIYLPPVADAETEAAPAAAAWTPAHGSETVLLAEDEATVRRLALRVLRRSGYTVLEAPDGEEALRVAKRHRGTIDVLVTDVVMPRMGGRELAARLRDSHPELPVLYVSGYNEEAVRQHGVLDPGTAFMSKPFTADQLLNHVRKVLDEAHHGARAG